jgi:hypothetical protein
MTYIEQFEAELVKKLQAGEDSAALGKWIREKVLESYKNGLAAGKKRSEKKSESEQPASSVPSQTH